MKTHPKSHLVKLLMTAAVSVCVIVHAAKGVERFWPGSVYGGSGSGTVGVENLSSELLLNVVVDWECDGTLYKPSHIYSYPAPIYSSTFLSTPSSPIMTTTNLSQSFISMTSIEVQFSEVTGTDGGYLDPGDIVYLDSDRHGMSTPLYDGEYTSVNFHLHMIAHYEYY
jgi:hypothetical protein